MKIGFAISAFALLTLNACQSKTSSTDADQPAQRTSFFDVSGMDTSVNPGDNFFLYANGGWIKANKIPEDESGWGSFYTLYNENQQKLKTILQNAAANKDAAKGSVEQKVGDYYASGMDTATIDQKGYEPLKPMLQKIDSVRNYKELVNLLSASYAQGNGDLLGFYVGPDEKNSTKNIAVLYQNGLTLPEKDYYTKTNSNTVAHRRQMVQYATKLFMLTGLDSATASSKASSILQLETAIAKSHRSPVELRDPQRNYNKMSLAQLQKLSPNVDWSAAFKNMQVSPDSINVGQPGYFAALSKLLASQPIDAWKAKVKFDYISSNAADLSKPFRDAEFNFSKSFSGQKVQKERWKTMVSNSDAGLKDLLSQLFVKQYFPPEAKKRMDELVNNLQAAFKKRIENLDWMTDSTRQKALAKLNSITKKIGYPDTWKNYDDVTITRDNFFANNESIAKHDYKEMIEKLGKPVDKTEWGMTPATVNAYYNPSFNEIVFPAGILQFPFFEMNADDAINYGGIGMVIGHEMTHGFDDQGRQYDAEGNLKEWWSPSDAEKFNAKTNEVVKQYDSYTILDSLHIIGKLTLGENLADLGGLAIAYDAYKMTDQGKGSEKIDGFTPDQRFFLGFAQVWRLINRDETMRLRVTTDPHSPEMFRVNGPLSNFAPFYAAFNLKAGDKMFKEPASRAKVW